ncbi:intradiol ring-cleavage dioxygenase [Deinococcus sp. KSM4-11]|uniref:intradiol ring-cleavage dioxygenase n=1 Tax=Deinococcus sp. KSM4-11 TaxID=2568654 RepID=UPI0010A4B0FF|nr:intradiol ring-cleavage dioxygenase [Deinococcus sp. KSM4-11]THF85176.1 intradiol ring-cleavage dioxygenase [Deinococcus sp. KSM4-11]
MNTLPAQLPPDDDDAQIGSIYSRRRALKLFGIGTLLAGGAALAGGGGPGGAGPMNPMGTSAGTTGVTGLPGCVVRPEQTQGPYWVDEKLNRRDIRADGKTGAVKAGVPLTLDFVVSRVSTSGCQPRADVMVDIWHCDALGVYSDATDPGYSTKGQNFLRGYQRTDAGGKVSFSTIFPGWYAGRAVHIHYRLRTLDGSGKVTSDFASQLFFPETLIDQVHATAPYKSKGKRDTLNATDQIYKNGGSQMLLTTTGTVASGLHATFDVGLNLG